MLLVRKMPSVCMPINYSHADHAPLATHAASEGGEVGADECGDSSSSVCAVRRGDSRSSGCALRTSVCHSAPCALRGCATRIAGVQ